MDNPKNQEDTSSEETNKEVRNWNPTKKMDIDPNMGGSFAYSDKQEHESIHTIADDTLNPGPQDLEGTSSKGSRARDSSANKDRQN
jgi:hypothetical protein